MGVEGHCVLAIDNSIKPCTVDQLLVSVPCTVDQLLVSVPCTVDQLIVSVHVPCTVDQLLVSVPCTVDQLLVSVSKTLSMHLGNHLHHPLGVLFC